MVWRAHFRTIQNEVVPTCDRTIFVDRAHVVRQERTGNLLVEIRIESDSICIGFVGGVFEFPQQLRHQERRSGITENAICDEDTFDRNGQCQKHTTIAAASFAGNRKALHVRIDLFIEVGEDAFDLRDDGVDGIEQSVLH